MPFIWVLSLIVLATIVALLAAGYFQKNRFMQISLPDGESRRVSNIDGLRGFLALGVLYHHYVITHHWKLTGDWIAPSNYFLNNIGQASVSLFFMITGYLFIGRTLQRKLNWKMFFISRFFRIVPLYFFIVVIMLGIIFYQSDFTLNQNVGSVLDEIKLWLLFQQPIVNNFSETMQVTAGVTWTLKYEWLFYILLPVIAVLMLIKGFLWVLIPTIIYFSFNPETVQITQTLTFETFFLILFLIGGFVAHLESKNILRQQQWQIYVNLIGLLALIFVLFYFKSAYGLIQSLILGIFFLSIIMGNDLFGLLRNKASIVLGEVSYSIYLLHGLIFYIAFSVLYPDFILEAGFFIYFLTLTFMTVLVVFASILSYMVIEKPMIEYGRHLQHKNQE